MHRRHVSWDNVQVVAHVSNFKGLVVLGSKACIGRKIAFRGSDPWYRGRLAAHRSSSHIWWNGRNQCWIAMRLSACCRRHGFSSVCRKGHAGIRYGIVAYVCAVYLCCEPRLIEVRHQIAILYSRQSFFHKHTDRLRQRNSQLARLTCPQDHSICI
jgi:hypothetical protein